MNNLQEATEKICELKGSLVALDALVSAMLRVMPPDAKEMLQPVFDQHAEVARTVLLHAPISEHSISAFERDVQRSARLLDRQVNASAAAAPSQACDDILLTVARIETFAGSAPLTAATGFFFEREGRLYLVSCRHVFIDEPTDHRPDRIEIELHTDGSNLTQATRLSVLLYQRGLANWRQASDAGGEIDVAVLPLDREALPNCLLQSWTPAHLETNPASVQVGAPLAIVGFPLGFHDTLHHLPVVRQGLVASSFGLRFQGQGYFLTDARTHRGTSGAPVLRNERGAWKLLGIHAARLDMNTRNADEDESLGLNSAWYADVLLALTEQA
jgi:hypothetical protein